MQEVVYSVCELFKNACIKPSQIDRFNKSFRSVKTKWFVAMFSYK